MTGIGKGAAGMCSLSIPIIVICEVIYSNLLSGRKYRGGKTKSETILHNIKKKPQIKFSCLHVGSCSSAPIMVGSSPWSHVQSILPLCYFYYITTVLQKQQQKIYWMSFCQGGKNFRLTWSQIRSAGQEVSKHCFDVATELLSCAYTCKHQFRSFPLNLLP